MQRPLIGACLLFVFGHCYVFKSVSFDYFEKSGSDYKFKEEKKPRTSTELDQMRHELDEIKREAARERGTFDLQDKKIDQNIEQLERVFSNLKAQNEAFEKNLNQTNDSMPSLYPDQLDSQIPSLNESSANFSKISFSSPEIFRASVKDLLQSKSDFKRVGLIRDLYQEIKNRIDDYSKQKKFLSELRDIAKIDAPKAVATLKDIDIRLSQIDALPDDINSRKFVNELDRAENLSRKIPLDRDQRINELLDEGFTPKIASDKDRSMLSRLVSTISAPLVTFEKSSHIQFSKLYQVCEIIQSTQDPFLYDAFWTRVREKRESGELSFNDEVLLMQNLPLSPDFERSPMVEDQKGTLNNLFDRELRSFSRKALSEINYEKQHSKIEALEQSLTDLAAQKKIEPELKQLIHERVVQTIDVAEKVADPINSVDRQEKISRLIDQDKINQLENYFNHLLMTADDESNEFKEQLKQISECIDHYQLDDSKLVKHEKARALKNQIEWILNEDESVITSSESEVINVLAAASKNPSLMQNFFEKLVSFKNSTVNWFSKLLDRVSARFTLVINNIGMEWESILQNLNYKAQRLQLVKDYQGSLDKIISGFDYFNRRDVLLYGVGLYDESLKVKLPLYAALPKPIFNGAVTLFNIANEIGKKIISLPRAFADYEGNLSLAITRREELERLKSIVQDIKENNPSLVAGGREIKGRIFKYVSDFISSWSDGVQALLGSTFQQRFDATQQAYLHAYAQYVDILYNASGAQAHDLLSQALVRRAYENLDPQMQSRLNAAAQEFLNSASTMRALYEEYAAQLSTYEEIMAFFMKSFDAVTVNLERKQNASLVTALLELHNSAYMRRAFLEDISLQLNSFNELIQSATQAVKRCEVTQKFVREIYKIVNLQTADAIEQQLQGAASIERALNARLEKLRASQ